MRKYFETGFAQFIHSFFCFLACRVRETKELSSHLRPYLVQEATATEPCMDREFGVSARATAEASRISGARGPPSGNLREGWDERGVTARERERGRDSFFERSLRSSRHAFRYGDDANVRER